MPSSAVAERTDGFTLIELLIVAAIIGTLAALAVPAYGRALEAARNARAISEIRAIDAEIRRYDLQWGHLPDTLAQVGVAVTTDPWGHPYQYLRILGAAAGGGAAGGRGGGGGGGGGGGAVAKARKDKNLVPINHDFDLYSMGPDGLSVPPLTAAHSRDDLVRASDGGFFGVARDF
jgi:general secretion pathway protein G